MSAKTTAVTATKTETSTTGRTQEVPPPPPDTTGGCTCFFPLPPINHSTTTSKLVYFFASPFGKRVCWYLQTVRGATVVMSTDTKTKAHDDSELFAFLLSSPR